jgi:hypothetical protein
MTESDFLAAIPIEEALRLAPGSRAFEMPDELPSDNTSGVWTALRMWLQERLSNDGHFEIVLGQDAFRALLQREQRQLKEGGVAGQELDEAVRESALNPDFRLLLNGRHLGGAWILCVPRGG